MGLNLRRADGAPPKLVGHRGALEIAPENTMASFQRALEDGADVIELDICLSADGHIVVMHDATVDRTTNGTGLVSVLTLAELKRLDAGAWFDPQFAGERVPTLAEVLAWARGRIGLMLELKYYPYGSFETNLVPATLDLVRQYDVADQVVFISFQPKGLAQVKVLMPEFTIGPMMPAGRALTRTVWLVRRLPWLKHLAFVRRTLLRPLTLTQAVGCDMVTPNIVIVTPELVQATHGAGLIISAGGFNWNYPDAIAMGLDTISANNPGRVRQMYLS
jgi:glycerophosphoryl diester phosphodiesterase